MCPGAIKGAQASNGSDEAKTGEEAHLLNLEQGDPTMCEAYWEKMGEEGAVTIAGGQKLSYFSADNFCWYLEPQLTEAIRRLHSVVGNAVTKDRYIVAGAGSTHLLHAALYATTLPYARLAEQVDVLSAAPYYSGYPDIAELMHSRLFKWGGDPALYDKDGPYVEVITSPNNPDGAIRGPVVPNHESRKGILIHDFAYLWPQYTPIGAPPDHDVMVFTLSKSTGHAGSRIGWALVRDKGVAEKMAHFIITTTIGVSREAQLRAAKIMGVLSDHCGREDDFFKYSQLLLNDRWKRLREVVRQTDIFTVNDYQPSYCSYTKDTVKPNPAFAWLSSEYISDAAKFFRGLKIRVRGGVCFGVEPKYVRVSMVGKDEDFNLFMQRIAAIKNSDLTAEDDHRV